MGWLKVSVSFMCFLDVILRISAVLQCFDVVCCTV